MFATALRRQFAAIVCTLVMSTACLVGAVGPAVSGTAAPAITWTVA